MVRKLGKHQRLPLYFFENVESAHHVTATVHKIFKMAASEGENTINFQNMENIDYFDDDLEDFLESIDGEEALEDISDEICDDVSIIERFEILKFEFYKVCLRFCCGSALMCGLSPAYYILSNPIILYIILSYQDFICINFDFSCNFRLQLGNLNVSFAPKHAKAKVV